MFTRQHYVAIASVIKTVLPGVNRADAAHIATHLAQMFDEDNPNFDWDRFMVACGFDRD